MTNKGLSLQDAQLRARMCRVLEGDYQTEDISKLFVGKRFASRGRSAFREIGDFAAHPDMRDKGPVTGSIRDMKAIMAPLVDDALGRPITADILVARVEANLRMATEEQIARLFPGFTRQKASKAVESFFAKSKSGRPFAVTVDERQLINRLAGSMLWNPVITADQLFEEFTRVMIDNRILRSNEVEKLLPAKDFITLYVLTVLHGVSYKLPDKNIGTLQVGYANDYGVLEVTAAIFMKSEPKSIEAKYCPLFTTLAGVEHCGSALANTPGPWSFPIELRNGKLEPIGPVFTSAPTGSKGVEVIPIKSDDPDHYWPHKPTA